MQIATALPAFAEVVTDQESMKRQVTYQLVLRGSDGVVLASDRRELSSPGPGDVGEGSTINMLTKIRIDPAGQFAWAFAGGEVAAIAAGYLERFIEETAITSLLDPDQALKSCGDRAWKDAARGANPNTTVVLVWGSSKRILRAKISPATIVEEIKEERCFAGQTYNVASFFPRHFHSEEQPVIEIATMAAYTVRMAHEIDQLCVDSLDMAVYRDSVGKFEFVDEDVYWKHAAKLDEEIRRCLKDNAIPIPPSVQD